MLATHAYKSKQTLDVKLSSVNPGNGLSGWNLRISSGRQSLDSKGESAQLYLC
jgi:hypothetical protein